MVYMTIIYFFSDPYYYVFKISMQYKLPPLWLTNLLAMQMWIH